MDIKVIYVNSAGLNQEHSESADSIKLFSLKTANYELTDDKLAKLIDGSDAANEHIHDARYWRENEHIDSSAGAGDGGKPIVLTAAGKVNTNMLDLPDINASLDHGALTGLGDDDHTIYLKADGTRNLTGIQSYATHPSFSADTQLVDKKYVDDKFLQDEWYDSCDDRAVTPPGSPTTGMRILIDATLGSPTGAFIGHDNKIAEWNGSAWIFQVPTTGSYVAIDDEPTVVYQFGGSTWSAKYFENTTASNGLVKVGNDIRIDAGAAGAGLGFSAGVLSVNVDDSSIEINSDTLRVKADGIKDTMIDFGTGAGQVNASDIPTIDAGNYTSASNVEDSLQELYGLISANGVSYTSGGVTKGDLVYVTSNDTVLPLTTLTSNARAIGLALTTVTAGSPVKVLANDTVLTGVLTGATAGNSYYWNGTSFQTTIPSGGGSNVWLCGLAKNATDLHVEVNHIKKNA
jgi:hypothetical protein